MSETLLAPRFEQRLVFGQRMLVPSGTDVRPMAVILGDYRGESYRGGSEEKLCLSYQVGMFFELSHPHLPARRRTFTPRSDRLMFKVRTFWQYDRTTPSNNLKRFRMEVERVAPILSAMEDLALQHYLAGELVFAELYTFFMDEYRRRSGAIGKRAIRR